MKDRQENTSWSKLYFFLIAYISYAAYYICRKNFSVMKVVLVHRFGFSKFSVGQLDTISSLSYGAGKMLCGMIADSCDVRFLLCGGLFLSGLLNVGMGIGLSSISMYILSILCILNSIVQACGWPACARILTFWLGTNNRGIWWGAFGSSYMVGESVSVLLVTSLLFVMPSSSGFWIPGLLCMILAVAIYYALAHDILPENSNSGIQIDEASRISTYEAFYLVCANWRVWIMSLGYVCVYFVRSCISDWMFLFVSESGGSAWGAALGMVCFNIGGILGMLCWGVLADRCVAQYRSRVPIIVIGMLMTGTISYLTQYVDLESGNTLALVMGGLGFCIFGPQMLSGLAVAETADLRAVSTATGFAGIFAYSGSAIAGAPLGKILDIYGWAVFFPAIFAASILACILYLVSFKPIKPSTI